MVGGADKNTSCHFLSFHDILLFWFHPICILHISLGSPVEIRAHFVGIKDQSWPSSFPDLNKSSNPKASNSSLWLMQKCASSTGTVLTSSHTPGEFLNRYFTWFCTGTSNSIKQNKTTTKHTNRENWPHGYIMLEHLLLISLTWYPCLITSPGCVGFYLMTLIFTLWKNRKSSYQDYCYLKRTHFCWLTSTAQLNRMKDNNGDCEKSSFL